MYKIADEYEINLISAQLKRLFHDEYDLIDNEVFMFRGYHDCENKDCAWCHKLDLLLGGLEDSENEHPYLSPNFWHKPTGLRVWWYKHIGRGMEVKIENKNANINLIFIEVEKHVPARIRERVANRFEISHSDEIRTNLLKVY